MNTQCGLRRGLARRALQALQAARRTSPQPVRIHPLVRDTDYVIARAESRPNEDLRTFAAWAETAKPTL